MNPETFLLASALDSPFFALAIGVAFIILTIAVFRFPAFIALMLAAIVVGTLAQSLPGDDGTLHMVKAIDLAMTEFGSTAGKIAWVIIIAGVVGFCLMESGAADRIVRGLINAFGEARAGWAMAVAAFILSIPVFFDTVFFLIIPLAQALAFRLGKRYLYFVMCVCAGGVITHGLVPPTPGPIIMIQNLKLDLGFAMIMGIALGLPVAVFGIWVASVLEKRVNISLRESPTIKMADLESIAAKDVKELPSFFLSLLPVVLPLVAIALSTIYGTFGGDALGEQLGTVITVLGNKNVAMGLGAAVAILIMMSHCKVKLSELWGRMDGTIAIAGTIVLITSAGGAFGAMIRHAGVGEAVRVATADTGLSLIILAWLIAAVMKVAQGSSTVAMITASGIMAAIIYPGDVTQAVGLTCHPVYLFAAVAFGSTVGSWMNDSGFWVVCKLSGFTEKETLRTWSVLLAAIGLFGLVQVLIVSKILPFGG